MKTPKKTFENPTISKPMASKKTSDNDEIQNNKIMDEDNDFDLPLDDLATFDNFDDDDDDSY